MTDEEAEARLAALENRVLYLEKNIYLFQVTVAKKLTDALGLLRGRQEEREKKVQDALKRLAGELLEIRNRLGAVKGPKVTH